MTPLYFRLRRTDTMKPHCGPQGVLIMRWQGGRQSGNVEDRRGMRGPVMAGGGLGMLVLIIIVMALGGDPRPLLQNMGNQPGAPNAGPLEPGGEETGVDDEMKQFVATVLADTEDVWERLFAEMNRRYENPKLVLFTGRVESACGFGTAASGPFYCPADAQVYIDLAFYDELQNRFGAPGDFAQAYVIAHEIGHHVQNQLGLSDKVHALRERVSEEEYNQYSVRLELQADFFAGVWAHHAQRVRKILEPGDLEEALNAATAIGDDRLQKQTRGYVVPDSFTHGTSQQRVRWFRRGFESGDPAKGDTFAVDYEDL
ncbi:MAG: neutral zinc metallopeptidase [Planctomycetaceae bacterium]|nr:neutral zinc metallopeptidase [Planctomycetaceae bacterium]